MKARSQSKYPSLPTEILSTIAGFLSSDCIQSFRLTCHLFRQIGDSYLVRSITLGRQRESQSNFLDVCNHEYFRHRVEQIRISLTKIYLVRNITRFTRLVSSPRRTSKVGKKHRALFQRYHEYQQAGDNEF